MKSTPNRPNRPPRLRRALARLTMDISESKPPSRMPDYFRVWSLIEARLGELLPPDSFEYLFYHGVMLRMYQNRAMEGCE